MRLEEKKKTEILKAYKLSIPFWDATVSWFIFLSIRFYKSFNSFLGCDYILLLTPATELQNLSIPFWDATQEIDKILNQQKQFNFQFLSGMRRILWNKIWRNTRLFFQFLSGMRRNDSLPRSARRSHYLSIPFWDATERDAEKGVSRHQDRIRFQFLSGMRHFKKKLVEIATINFQFLSGMRLYLFIFLWSYPGQSRFQFLSGMRPILPENSNLKKELTFNSFLGCDFFGTPRRPGLATLSIPFWDATLWRGKSTAI